MKQLLPKAWYGNATWVKLLYPVSLLYRLLSDRNKHHWQRDGLAWQARVPVVVTGNITVGGTGKTPLTLALAAWLRKQDMHPVIISRGYGGHSRHYPLHVHRDTAVKACGDEALLMAQQEICPVVVDPQRVRAAQFAQDELQADVILCDDGLQHYALARDMEIAVIDGSRGLGNGLLLPAGPLRESPDRLAQVDHVVINGAPCTEIPVRMADTVQMHLTAGMLCNLASGERLAVSEFFAIHGNEPVHAVAGIGNPARFFRTLEEAGFVIMPHPLADHHHFTREDVDFGDGLQVVMTEKDAVKCREFSSLQHWALQVNTLIDENWLRRVEAEIRAVVRPVTRETEYARQETA
jgi:tetraacyldisaccharide 4'-kinase